jgi:hypothetical protein
MPESNHLGLPFLEAGQAQKHVTHNEALRILDALVQLSVTAVSASPPGSPAEGERHIVAEGASAAFASKDGQVAVYEDGAWRFLAPRNGWRAWNEDEEALLVWTGAAWSALETGGAGGGGGFDPDDADHLYLNDAAPEDADVKFAMRGKSALLHAIPVAESGDGDVRLQISKETSADTASVFFSTNFSGRAEFGLIGGDDFKLKVSADGENWVESLLVDPASGSAAVARAVAFSGTVSPDEIDADQDDFAPTGSAGASVLRLSTDASRSLTGLAGGSTGRIIVIQNIGGNDLVLQSEASASAAANRFALSTDVTIGANQCAILQYDSGASRWRALAAPGASGGFEGSSSTDQEFLDAQLSLALANALNAAQFSGENGNRVADSFGALTYIDTGSSTNMSTATSGQIKPTSSASASYPSSGGLSGSGIAASLSGLTLAAGSTSNLIDGSLSNVAFFNNAQSSGSLIFDAGSGNTQFWEAWRWRQDSGAANGTWELSGGPDGSSWTVEHASAAMGGSSSVETIVTSPAATRYKRLRIVSGTTSNTPFVQEIEAKLSSSAPTTNNMTALSAAFTAASAPSSIRAVLRAKFVDAITINTDLVVEVSRDDGTTWSAGTLADKFTTPGTSHHVLDTGDISVSGQPSGTSIRWRIKTLNNKNLEIHDAYLRWS